MSAALLAMLGGNTAGGGGGAATTLVQTSAIKTDVNNLTTTFTFTMPGSFTAGNSAVLSGASYTSGASVPPSSVSIGGNAATMAISKADVGTANYQTSIWYVQTLTGSSSTVVVTYANATGGYFSGSCEEWTAFASTCLDQTASGSILDTSTNAFLDITTGAKSQNIEIVYAVVQDDRESIALTLVGPTSGYTQTALQSGASANILVAAGYKKVNGAGTETAHWTISPGGIINELSGCMATFKAN